VQLPGVEIEIFVLACEDLILHKLAAGRVVDRVDAAALLRANRLALDMTYLQGWLRRVATASDWATADDWGIFSTRTESEAIHLAITGMKLLRRDSMPRSVPYSNYRMTVRVELQNVPGQFARLATLLAEEKANLVAVDIVEVTCERMVRDVTFDANTTPCG